MPFAGTATSHNSSIPLMASRCAPLVMIPARPITFNNARCCSLRRTAGKGTRESIQNSSSGRSRWAFNCGPSSKPFVEGDTYLLMFASGRLSSPTPVVHEDFGVQIHPLFVHWSSPAIGSPLPLFALPSLALYPSSIFFTPIPAVKHCSFSRASGNTYVVLCL